MKNAVVSASWAFQLPPIDAFLFNILFLVASFTTTTTANAQYLVEILERAQLGGHRPVVRCEATGANFGGDVISFSFGMSAIGCALPAEPAEACGNVTKPELNSTVAHCFFDFAVVPRGNCTFSEKAFFAQNAEPSGYSALILFSGKGQSPIPMSGSKYAEQVTIPVVMVNYGCMQSLLFGPYSARHGYVVTIKASPGYYDLIKYLVPFVAIVGICFVVLFISLMIRLCRERRRLARKRLPRSYLKKIPTKKYRKGDPEETCAICLEDFQEAEKLRVLPCRHAYHCKCIDPWLTKSRKVCPVCKRRVGPRNSDSSDTDETDAERTPSTTAGRAVSGGGLTAPSSAPLLSSRDNDSLLRNAQPMATTSSASGAAGLSFASDCPYPQNVPTSHGTATITTIEGSTFLRTATTNYLAHLSNIFHRRAASPSAADTSTVLHADGNDHHNRRGTADPSNTTAQQLLLSSAALDDALATRRSVSDVQHQPLPTTTATATASNAVPEQPLHQLVRSRWAGMRATLANMISRHQRSDGSNPPHTLLENEEDNASTTLTTASSGGRGGEADTLSARTCDTFDDAYGGGGSSSIDGHSMTTVHSSSNRHFVSATVPPVSIVVNLSSCCNCTTNNCCRCNNSNEFKQLPPPPAEGGGGEQ
ncbi:hypothetical protein niasHT_039518 [Heterodera trifolii]|uniref:RING-type domain-containing protein n=1 Tax=Heterodera trifolii TaxID=157864 RepID=A0ABD2IWC1_9BILA